MISNPSSLTDQLCNLVERIALEMKNIKQLAVLTFAPERSYEFVSDGAQTVFNVEPYSKVDVYVDGVLCKETESYIGDSSGVISMVDRYPEGTQITIKIRELL